MHIGIIGAGIAGLTAGRVLAEAGHQVTVLEKSKGFGGRMATRYAGEDLHSRVDHGITHFSAEGPDFQVLVKELAGKGLVQSWGDRFLYFTGETLLSTDPVQTKTLYTSTKGMNAIARHLARPMDVRLGERVNGVTYFGPHRNRKTAWMINLESSQVVEVDAVIIATPAPQAWGILNLTQDETDTLALIRQIDEVTYAPSFSLLAGYKGHQTPDWQGIECEDSILDFVSNESLKRGDEWGTVLSVNASQAFSTVHLNSDRDAVERLLLQELQRIAGLWAGTPTWSQIHLWRYSRCRNPLPVPFIERESPEAPLALVGDYFNGNTVESAYLSGLALGQAWKKKLARKKTVSA